MNFSRVLPRTLFGRHVLLITALILVAVVGILVLFRQMAQEPVRMQRVQVIVQQARVLRAALEAIEPARRQATIAQLRQDGVMLILQNRSPLSLTEPADRLPRELVQRLSQQLPAYQVYWQETPRRRVWLRTAIDGTDYWFGFPARQLGANVSSLLWAVVIVAVLTALLGALLLRYVVNRPLQSIAESAGKIVSKLGKGEIEPVHLPHAPEEIAQVAAALNQMARDLRTVEEDRALMLAGVSHDLRTPLSKLRLIAGIIEPHTEKELIETMKRSLAAADLVIDQFIDFSRTGAEEPMQVCDVNELALGAARSTGASQTQLQIQLEPGTLPPLLCRPLALHRAVVNLLENALRHAVGAEAGGQPGAPITLSTAYRDGCIEITVADRGPGIPETELERLRRPFTRLHSSRSGQPGSGLGLAIVDRIASMHQGSFILRNRAGGGLEAVLRLPVTEQS